MLIEHDPQRLPCQQPRQLRHAFRQRQRAEILAVELQKVERIQHRIRGVVPAVERIEHGDAVGAGYFLTSFAATSVTALQVNSTKS
jgi:hypothetical protein